MQVSNLSEKYGQKCLHMIKNGLGYCNDTTALKRIFVKKILLLLGCSKSVIFSILGFACGAQEGVC